MPWFRGFNSGSPASLALASTKVSQLALRIHGGSGGVRLPA